MNDFGEAGRPSRFRLAPPKEEGNIYFERSLKELGKEFLLQLWLGEGGIYPEQIRCT
jgi:hypothetical protein